MDTSRHLVPLGLLFQLVLICLVQHAKAAHDVDRRAWVETLGWNSTTYEAAGAYAVQTADLDGDGYPDIVVAQYASDRLAWARNDGRGNFGPTLTIDAGANVLDARALAIADLDADGHIDVLLGSEGTDQVAWYRNEGPTRNTSFTGPYLVSAIETKDPLAMAAGDLSGNGFMDVVCATNVYRGGFIAYFLNRGRGQFLARTILADGVQVSQIRNIQLGDLDLDGDLDIIAGSYYTDHLFWFMNLGDGTFSEIISISHSAPGPESIALGDFDGDGDIDVAVSMIYNGYLTWFRNTLDTDPTLDAQSSFPALDLLGNWDVDGNDIPDIVARRSDSSLVWFFNSDLTEPRAWDAQDFGTSELLVGAADFDSDGHPDLLASGGSARAGAWVSRNAAYAVTRGGALAALATGDLDGDGRDDLVTAEGLEGRLDWYRSLGDGRFSPRGMQNPNATVDDLWPRATAAVVVVDMDNDGDLDVLAANNIDNVVVWYPNQGGGALSEARRVASTTTQVVHLSTFDANGDGALDVLVLDAGRGSMSWHRSDGLGSFFPLPYSLGTNLTGLKMACVGDLDGDGFTDVIANVVHAKRLGWFRNAGDGTFSVSNATLLPGQLPPVDVLALGDLDGDGHLDVVVGTAATSTILWYPNMGNGTFTAARVLTQTASGVHQLLLGDIDADDDVDVIAYLHGAKELVVLPNRGQGLFDPAVVLSRAQHDIVALVLGSETSAGVNSIFAASYSQGTVLQFDNATVPGVLHLHPVVDHSDTALLAAPIDLNGDGAPDIVGASVTDGTIFWYRNQDGTGSFSPMPNVIAPALGSASVSILTTGDLNADGFLDVVAVDGESGTVRWYQHLPNGTFAAQPTVLGGLSNIIALELADIDADNATDVLAAVSSRSGSGAETVDLLWLRNHGPGQFEAEARIVARGVAQQLHTLTVGDIDRDGALDVLPARGEGTRLAWYRQSPDGVFTAHHLAPLVEETRAFSVMMIAASALAGSRGLAVSVDDTVSLWSNKQTFVEEPVISYNIFPAGLAAADFDQDGDLDLLNMGTTGFWYENNGFGTFSHQRAVTSRASRGVSVADFDLNGRPDAVCAEPDLNTFSVLLSTLYVWLDNLRMGDINDNSPDHDHLRSSNTSHSCCCLRQPLFHRDIGCYRCFASSRSSRHSCLATPVSHMDVFQRPAVALKVFEGIEIFNPESSPYGLQTLQMIMEALSAGIRLSLDNVPKPLRPFIHECWQANPTARPTADAAATAATAASLALRNSHQTNATFDATTAAAALMADTSESVL
ncbi:uncharacterized protein MONBRDRAFT_12189 [Monosiga brevicollis MX1]|uniref:Protein kinase domain-containing protein n=1 Tax=Monosiga brevicollis TaxID=81824 RepID=A9VBH4_MONBE|nr:uncharacterized protein MONBRDRAFT_12189 [Monosiga brevicollis MX1]EDQ85061.1 predicted protein [Monosiga brevicollis MX1]|eukprot:XP_001750065.1 hypothetical protein [Monosiga brevicollis MX1]